MSIDYQQLLIHESELGPVRSAIYDHDQPGYFLFRNFLGSETVKKIAEFWSNRPHRLSHERYVGQYGLYKGCPNYVEEGVNDSVSFFNFFWNQPADALTYSVAQQVQFLRNRVEGAAPYREFFPLADRSASFRVVSNRNGSDLVPSHRDWLGENGDPKRTQITLFLTEKGPDYEGSGFMFTNNQGVRLSMGTDVPVAAGDLMLWRYNNEHAIDVVRSNETQRGFMRIIFPPERIHNSFPLGAIGLPLIRPAVSFGYRARYILPHVAHARFSAILGRR